MKKTDLGYRNVFTVDVEDWYQATDLKIDRRDWVDCKSRITDNTVRILDLLDEFNVKALFFVLTDIAVQFPNLIRRIREAGHEIGSHGCTHRLVSDMSSEEFLRDFLKSKDVLEDITGEELSYYRAPAWSVSHRNLWALELLDQEGIVCDSSMQPIKTPLSGDRQSPVEPFHPIVNGRQLSLVEFPSTVWTKGCIRLPFAGGLFLRMMPKGFITKALAQVNQKRPGMVYVHPWEIDCRQPRISKPYYVAVTHYGNLGSTIPKLKMLLEGFEFVTMKEFLESGFFPGKTLGDWHLESNI